MKRPEGLPIRNPQSAVRNLLCFGFRALPLLCLPLACTLVPTALSPPEGASVVSGGIIDTRPYFGTLRAACGLPAGDFLIATCGCGDWRALVTPSADSPQRQFTVRFYSGGPYLETGPVDLFGEDEPDAISGRVDQDTGAAAGDLLMSQRLYRFEAQRTDTHTDDAAACVKCHVGDDPIYPQPPTHPTFTLDPPNCLSCHTVVIAP